MRDKPLNAITVRELTETADINRSTFYAYYETIDQLVRQIEQEYAEKIISSFEKEEYNSPDFISRTISLFVETVIQDPEAAFWFLDPSVTGYGRKLVHDTAEAKFVPLWMGNRNISEIRARYSYEYIYDGCIGILTRWYEHPGEIDTKTLSETFRLLSENTLKLLH